MFKNVFGQELKVGPNTNAYGQDLEQLRKNYEESKATLERQGYKLESTAMAGLDSGSTWVHPAGDTATITVRKGNLVTYSDLRAMWTREHGAELAEKLLALV